MSADRSSSAAVSAFDGHSWVHTVPSHARAPARAALDDLTDLPLQRVPHRTLLARAWALRDNASFCDGDCLALTEALDAPLITLDARLAGAPGTRATVHVLA